MTDNGNKSGTSNTGPTRESVGGFLIFTGIVFTTFFAGMKIRQWKEERRANTETVSD